MPSRLLMMFTLVLGFLLAVFALAWSITLSFQRKIAENSGPLAILIIVAIILMIIGWKG